MLILDHHEGRPDGMVMQGWLRQRGGGVGWVGRLCTFAGTVSWPRAGYGALRTIARATNRSDGYAANN